MLTKQLIFEEGLKLNAYKCPAGFKTIGIGHNLDANPTFKGVKIPDRISKEFALKILNSDIEQTRIELGKKCNLVLNLDDARRDACVNMAFQLGVDGFLRFKKTIEYIKSGFYDKAASEALRSDWAKQTPNRAFRVTWQLRYGEYYKVG